MKKRGMSNVVATVLIVLISLSAVSLSWIFIKPIFTESGETIEQTKILESAKLSIVPNTMNITDDGNITFYIEGKSGLSGISGFIIVLTDSNGGTETIEKYSNTKIKEIERIKVEILNTEYSLTNIKIISIHASIVDGDEINIANTPTDTFEFPEPIMPPECIPEDEICDDIDNDCDTLIDEDGVCDVPRTTTTFQEIASRKFRVAYTYYHSTSESEIQELIDHGINSFIIKNYYTENTDYSSEPDGVPKGIKEFGIMAKNKDVVFFPGINFVHRQFNDACDTGTDCSIFSNNYNVFGNGEAGTHVSMFDEDYWDKLTEMVVALAQLPITYPNVRIDGVWFDHELYNGEDFGEPRGLDYSWGFEDHIFGKYVENRGLSHLSPPIASNQRDERYNWIRASSSLDDYYSFLGDTIEQLAENMKNEVEAVNPDFIIGAYQSPNNLYESSIFDGWSSRTKPTIIWGTEMYYGGGANRVPVGNDDLLPEGYYDLSSAYNNNGEYPTEIYGYYIGGVANREYLSADWAYHLYNLAKDSSGYWIWTTFMFTGDYERLLRQDPKNRGWLVKCYDEEANEVWDCADSTEYDNAVNIYYNQMDLAHEELEKYLENSGYVSNLSKTDPPPIEFNNPTIPELREDILDTVQPSTGGNLNYPPQELRGQHDFVFQAEQNQIVEINLLLRKIGNSVPEHGTTYFLLDSEGNEVLRKITRSNHSEKISFTSPDNGKYYLLVNPQSKGYVKIESSNVPLMIYSPDKEIHFFTSGSGGKSELYFWVDDSLGEFEIKFEGDSVSEGVAATIYNPSGNLITYGETGEFLPAEFTLNVDPDTAGIWKIEMKETSAGNGLEDFYINSTSGIDPYFSLTDNSEYFLVVQ
ncbi:MAG: hypothetical protein ABIG28_00630 [archaeon]